MPSTFNYNAHASIFDYEGFATITGGTITASTGTRSVISATGPTGDTSVLSATTWTTIQTNYINTGTPWATLPTAVGMDKNVLRTALLLGYLKKYRNYDVDGTGAPVKRHRGRSGG